jgi:COMPASS component SWD3
VKTKFKDYPNLSKLRRRVDARIYKEVKDDSIIQDLNETWVNYVEPSQNMNTLEGCLFMMNFNKDGSILSTSSVNDIDFWDMKTRKKICTLNDHKEIVTNLEWFKEPLGNKFVSCSLDKTIKIWDNYKCQITLDHHTDWLRCMSISLDNQFLLSGCVSALVMGYDLNKMKVAFNIKHRIDNNMLNTINTLCFKHSDNTFLTGTRDGYVRIFDIRDVKKPTYEIFAHNNKLNSACFAENDLTILSSGRDSTSRIWDLRYLSKNTEHVKSKGISGQLMEFKGHKSQGYNIASYFFGGEDYVITGSEDSNIYIYKTADASLVRKIPTKSKIIHILKPLPDPHFGFAFSGLQENYIHFFDANTSVNDPDPNKAQKLADNKIDFEEETLKLIEEFMSEHGDLILKVFHKNNYTYTSGMTWENLLRIVTQEEDDESKELLKKFNEELIKKMQCQFTNGFQNRNPTGQPAQQPEGVTAGIKGGCIDSRISPKSIRSDFMNSQHFKYCETCDKIRENMYSQKMKNHSQQHLNMNKDLISSLP